LRFCATTFCVGCGCFAMVWEALGARMGEAVERPQRHKGPTRLSPYG
jgi:hypothetical protein